MGYLESRGELKEVTKEVNRVKEAQLIATKSAIEGGPALLFKNVKGYETPVLVGILATKQRMYYAFETTRENFAKKFQNALRNPVRTKTTHKGICQEVILDGEKKADLESIPALWHNEKDRGFYISGGVFVGIDPDTNIQNMSIHRALILDKKKLAVWINVPMHLRIIARKYLDKGKPCPVAIVAGNDPTLLIAASAKLPFGVNELEFAGALNNEPVEVTKCLNSDLLVPATSELVIEGEFVPGDEEGALGKSEYAVEGPFGEFSGYYGSIVRSPIFHVKAITHREGYIYSEMEGLISGRDQPLHIVPMESVVWNGVRQVCPEQNIRGVNIPLSSAGFKAIVSIRKTLPAEGMRIANAVFSAQHTIKQVIVVNDDIDPYDPNEVEWAVATRSRHEDYNFHESTGQALDPVARNVSISSKVAIDATLPLGGDKLGKEDVLKELGPCRMLTEDINLSDYF